MLANATDYSKDFLNKLYILEEETFMEEEILLKESLLNILSEGSLTDKLSKSLKNFFQSFIAAVKGIYKKFIDNVTYLFKTSEKWLIENKDYIFNADVTDFKQQVFPYWIASTINQNIDNKLQPVNDQLIKTIYEDGNNKEKFRKKCLDNLGIKNVRTDDNFEEDLKIVLRGNNSKLIEGVKIRTHIKEMYDYCLNYKNEYKKVNKLKDNIIDICNKAINELNTNKALNTASKLDPNKQRENSTMTESEIIELIFENSSLLDAIIYEDQDNIQGAAEKVKGPSNPSELKKENDKIQEEKEKNKMTQEKFDKKYIEGTDKYINSYTICLKVYQNFLTIRISIMEERFKQYMKTLRIIARMGMSQPLHKQEKGQTANNYENRSNTQQAKDGVKDIIKAGKNSISDKTKNTINTLKHGTAAAAFKAGKAAGKTSIRIKNFGKNKR